MNKLDEIMCQLEQECSHNTVRPSKKDILHMSNITGLGLRMCKLALQKYGGINNAILCLRSLSDEPKDSLITQERWDVVDKYGNIVFSCREMSSSWCSPNYRMRYVNRLGFYIYTK